MATGDTPHHEMNNLTPEELFSLGVEFGIGQTKRDLAKTNDPRHPEILRKEGSVAYLKRLRLDSARENEEAEFYLQRLTDIPFETLKVNQHFWKGWFAGMKKVVDERQVP